jgi:hypothetical protein
LREYYGFLEFLKLLKSHPRSSLITCHCLMFIIKHTFSFSKTWTTNFLLLCVLWGISPEQKNIRGWSLGERTSSYSKMFLHSHKKTMVYMPGGSVLVDSPNVGFGNSLGLTPSGCPFCLKSTSPYQACHSLINLLFK